MSADKNGDDVWIAAFPGGNLLRVNTRTLKVSVYPLPGAGLNPYMTAIDNSHNVWVSLQDADSIAKFDPRTEKWTLYDLPSRGIGMRNLYLLDRDGVVQLVGAYFNAGRVGQLVMRTKEDAQALKIQVGTAIARDE